MPKSARRRAPISEARLAEMRASLGGLPAKERFYSPLEALGELEGELRALRERNYTCKEIRAHLKDNFKLGFTIGDILVLCEKGFDALAAKIESGGRGRPRADPPPGEGG